MNNVNEPYRCVIIGLGPRGLFALEQLLATFAKNSQIDLDVHIYESSDYAGCGPNYAPDQSVNNQLNIPLRDVPLDERASVNGKISIASFASFIDWYQSKRPIDDKEVDHFPPRARIGEYLQARLKTFLDDPSVASCVTLHTETVISLIPQSPGWKVDTNISSHDICFDEALLSIGHQPTEIDSALLDWKNSLEASDARVLYLEPYPTSLIAKNNKISTDTRVALRGMGLSMIDVVKSLTLDRGGKFISLDKKRMELRYEKSGNEPLRIVPFSLDGQPMTPKPINQLIDSRFRPDEDLLLAAEQALNFDSFLPTGEYDLRNILIDVVCNSIVDVFRGFNDIEHAASSPEYSLVSAKSIRRATRQWLVDEAFAHPLLVNSHLPTAELMQRFLDMATGHCPPSLDYCIGQVWKHLQPTFYQQLSFNKFKPDVIKSAMSLDERLKRYAFGPPVEAVAGLLALSTADLLHFRIADDPDITLEADGWTFCQGDNVINAKCLINTVLSPANVTAMDSELVSSLKQQDLLPLVHDTLGAVATSESLVVNHKSTLCATGRIIMGSVFEADALLCCFGEDMPRWAASVEQRALAH